MRFATICSGSSGNCVYVGGGKTHVLVDGGCSLKALKAALSQFSVGEGALKALFITHEHTDHINGAARIAKHFGIPVFASEQTWEKLPFREDFFPWQRHKFEYGMEIGELGLDFFRLSHDAVQPVGMLFEHAGKRVAVATDTGSITPSMKRMLSNIEGLVFEANYCADMLRCGPYPQFLKQRILSSHGHLSNRQSGQALAALLGERSQAVVLAHLSHTNNEPERAMKQVCEELQGCPHMEHVHISVAPRSTAHPLIELY